ncbi:hypothetical protein CARUB_v10021852mg [Capsella rubella]|uniref:adenylate dimethylallyltransferase (ADP/ATP-dependent) n=1 Tax=Capsella rubella TaxID=81985 RepID=R0GET5_9BRAS|nr:adenylate isopentenyltransferase 1, chloroplastic [Capsella rubella]EOA34332.1 hypothetical protein CARUB_v10021852mg [Capsella rubella]
MTELNFLLPTISDRLIAATTTTSPSFSSSSHSSSSLISFTKRRRKHQPLVSSSSIRMEQYYSPQKNRKDKVVVILGATGAGKSKLSVDLATRFPSEIINSDKIQVYEGLEITTNQITLQDRRGVPHHLLGYLNPEHGELTAAEFRSAASNAVSDITSRQKLPIIAGGSNSFIHALLAQRFDPKIDPFSSGSGLITSDLRYECRFIWVDVSEIVLYEYLLKRVDEMMDSGMFEELSGFYDPVKSGLTPRFGIRKAIGVPEFDGYFKEYPPETIKWDDDDGLRKAAYDKAVDDIKRNTWTLAKRQIKKIEMLKDAGWEIERVDATASFKEVMKMSSSSEKWREVWEEQVLEPSVKIVKRLLVED